MLFADSASCVFRVFSDNFIEGPNHIVDITVAKLLDKNEICRPGRGEGSLRRLRDTTLARGASVGRGEYAPSHRPVVLRERDTNRTLQ